MGALFSALVTHACIAALDEKPGQMKSIQIDKEAEGQEYK